MCIRDRFFSFLASPRGCLCCRASAAKCVPHGEGANEAARSQNPCIHAASKNPADGYNAALRWAKSMGKACFPQVSWVFLPILPISGLFSWFFVPSDSSTPIMTALRRSTHLPLPELLFQAEEHLFSRCLRCRDGCIQRIHYGRGDLEIANQRCGEVWLESLRRGQRGSQSPLTAADQVHARMLGRKSLGWARQRIPFKLRECFADGRLLQQLAELGVVVQQPVADRGELIFLRHVSPGGDDHFLGAHVEVVAGARCLFQPLMRPPCGHVGFVGHLVGAEARVAVDTEEALLCRPHECWRKVHHRIGNFADDRQHWFLQLRFEEGLAWREPFAVVVACQVAEKGESFRAEVRDSCGGSGFFGARHSDGRLAKMTNLRDSICCEELYRVVIERKRHSLRRAGPFSRGAC